MAFESQSQNGVGVFDDISFGLAMLPKQLEINNNTESPFELRLRLPDPSLAIKVSPFYSYNYRGVLITMLDGIGLFFLPFMNHFINLNYFLSPTFGSLAIYNKETG